MEKLWEGYYYRVYAKNATRVVKRQTNYLSKLRKLCQWYSGEPKKLLRYIVHIRSRKNASLISSRTLADILELKELLGHPLFINNFEYEQDRAVPLENIVASTDTDSILDCVQQYIDANIKLWEHGFGDQVFNFTYNYGRSFITNKVIVLDFNELSRDKAEVAVDIDKKKWRTQRSMLTIQKETPDLYTEIDSLLCAGFTRESLDIHWQNNDFINTKL